MLKNPTYLGHMVQGRHQVKSYKVHTIVPIPEDDWFWVENTHEAIIDQQTFDRAQELLEKNVRTSPKAKNGLSVFRLPPLWGLWPGHDAPDFQGVHLL